MMMIRDPLIALFAGMAIQLLLVAGLAAYTCANQRQTIELLVFAASIYGYFAFTSWVICATHRWGSRRRVRCTAKENEQ